MEISQHQIDDAAEKAKAALDSLAKIRKAFAEQECPHKVGDTVDICGYSFKGKQMQVVAVCPNEWDYYGKWKVIGRVIKKDGTLGEQNAEYTERQYHEAKRAQIAARAEQESSNG